MRNRNGQVALLGLGFLFALTLLTLGFMRWASRSLWQMRLSMAADASALSSARAQAQVLNTIATTQDSLNAFFYKAQVPLINREAAVVLEPYWPAAKAVLMTLALQDRGFNGFSAASGILTARENGFLAVPTLPIGHHLAKKSLPVFVVAPHPPFVIQHRESLTYFARNWSPNFVKAQPDHRARWQVSGHGGSASATARVWLDVPTGSLLHNGGFPRVQESLLRSFLIQSFYPQFNARLQG
jgi:hypothetical protein